MKLFSLFIALIQARFIDEAGMPLTEGDHETLQDHHNKRCRRCEHSSKKLGIFACACVRVRTIKFFSRARACACASFENFECACVRVRTFKNFSRARACACAFFQIFACACAHVRARARSCVFILIILIIE